MGLIRGNYAKGREREREGGNLDSERQTDNLLLSFDHLSRRRHDNRFRDRQEGRRRRRWRRKSERGASKVTE